MIFNFDQVLSQLFVKIDKHPTVLHINTMAFRAVFLLALPCVQADESCLQEETTLLQIRGTAARSGTSMAKHIDEPTLQNEDENCWNPCVQTAGPCDYCGTEGVCCREGWSSDPEECGGLGGGLGSDHHSCRLPVDLVVGGGDATMWEQHGGDHSKCNKNVDVQYVSSQMECQQVASAAGHAYYSFRHNALASKQSQLHGGDHACMSSATCENLTGRTNEWNMYVATHYYAVNSWPEHAWGAYDSEARVSSIEKCLLKEQTEDADGSGYLFTSCCTIEGVGMSRDCGSTKNTNWDTAVAQCASQGGRLCTADEAMSQVTVSQGCDVDGPSSATGADLNRLWTSTPCTLSA